MRTRPSRRSTKTTPREWTLPFSLPSRPQSRRVRGDAGSVGAASAAAKRRGVSQNGEYADIVDYILRITDHIWVNRAIGGIYSAYDHACTVFHAEAIMRSVEELVADCVETLHAFSKLRIEHIGVAWREEGDGEAHTSYIGRYYAVNAAASRFGPATGRPVSVLCAVDRMSRDFRIHTEWRVVDTGALVRQLGVDLHGVARRLADLSLRETWIVAPPTRLIGQVPQAPLDESTEDVQGWARSLLHTLWNLKQLDLLSNYYQADVMVHAPGGRRIKGLGKLSELLLAIQASLPDAIVRVDQVSHAEESDGVLVAARWVLEGTTCADGLLGDIPPRRPVFVLGISHFRLTGQKICEEWMLFDEMSILTQAFRRVEI